jgi:regulator of sigma E protease
MSKKSSLKPSNFSGPIGIFRAIGITAYRGSFSRVLNLIVIITFSLGLFNLLPVPVLDGGHISIAVIETIIGRPIPLKLLQPITVAFIIILISFMLFVSYYDVIRVHSDFSKKKQNVATYNSETTEKSDAAKSENEAKKNVDKKTPDKKD